MHRRGIRGQKLTASPPAPDSLRRRIAGPLLIAALAVLFLGRVFFTGDVLLPAGYLYHFQPWQAQAPPPPQQHWNALIWDAAAQYYPWRAFAHHAIAGGVIPLWNPFQFCGMPFVANSQSAVFYPPNGLFYLLDPARAFAIAAALHLLLAGLFTYLLLRALGCGRFGATFGAVAFAFCAFFAAWLQLPTVLDTGVWLPLALFFIVRYFATRRPGYAIGLGVTVGTALLAGHPQMFLYVAGVSAVYFIFNALSDPGARARLHRVAGWLGMGAGAAVLAFLWGAVQLLPSAELLPLSHRATVASAQGYGAYLRFAMPWQQLITVILPEFMGNPAYGTYWGRGNFAEYAAYAGVLPLALAMLGVIWKRDKHALFFAALAVFALLAALGTPVNLLLFYGVPGFSSTGGPQRMLFIYSAAVAVLAGMGADAAARAFADPQAARRFARHLSAAAAMIVAVAIAFVFAIALSLRVAVWSLLSAPALNILVALLALAAGVGAYWAASRGDAKGARAALAVLLAAAVFELFMFGMSYHQTAPVGSVYPATELTTYLEEHADGGRVMPLHQSWGLRDFPRAVLPPNAAMVYGIRDVQGYDSLYLARYRSVLAAVEGRDPSPQANGNMLLGAPADPSLLPALGVRYVLSPVALDVPGLALERAGEVNVYRVENSVPRAYVARAAVAAAGVLDALPKLSAASRGGAVLETTGPLPQAAASRGAPGDVTFARQGLNRVRLKASGPGYLVLSDAYYPGWRAWVDGRPAEIRIANGAFRAVWVRPGGHEVEMRFEPSSFRLGLFATLVAAAIAMAALGAGVASRARFRRAGGA